MGLIGWIESFFDGRRLAWLYVCFALPIGLFLAVATPPFQTPDSVNHFYRAIQVSEGQLHSVRAGATSGGWIDESVVGFADAFSPMAAHKDVKVDGSMLAQAAGRHWGGARRVVEFPGTAIYPAYAYLPQAVTIAVARVINMSVPSTYRLTCITDLLVSVGLTVWALLIGRRTSLWIFAVGLLPSTLMLYSSVSQEVILLPACFLLVAALDRAFEDPSPLGRVALVAGCLVLVACLTARPPYAGLLLLYFCPALRLDAQVSRYALVRRCLWVAATTLVAVTVIVLFSRTTWAPVPPPRSVVGQISWLLHHPMAIPHLAVATLRQNGLFYYQSFIGVLGWLDTHMHAGYYRIFGVMAAALAVVTLLERAAATDAARGADRAIVASAFVACLAMIFAALYLSWTPVGQEVVDGVQGRYFLPLVPLLALVLPARHGGGTDKGTVRAAKVLCLAIVLIFPVYTFMETMQVVLDRFYG